MDAAALEEWLPRYLDATVRLHHPGSMAHQVAVPSTGAAVADLIHGATNNPMAIYEMGAAGATIEREVVRWMLDKVGFGSGAAGVLTSGGSLANLTALLAARAHVAPDAWRAGTPSRPRAARTAVRALLGPARRGDPRARRGRGPGARGRRARADPARPARGRARALCGGRPPAARAGRPRMRHQHRPLRRPARDRLLLPRARDLAARRRRSRRLGAAVGAPPRPARRHRARRLGRLGCPQAAAHVRPLRGCPDPPRSGPARRVSPERRLPLQRQRVGRLRSARPRARDDQDDDGPQAVPVARVGGGARTR